MKGYHLIQLSLVISAAGVGAREVLNDGDVRVMDICQKFSRSVKCGRGLVIYVQHGWYGRIDKETCVADLVPTACHPEDSSYRKIWEDCEGKNECRLIASDAFMDSKKCLTTERYMKYIHIEYRCHEPGQTTVGKCLAPLAWGPWFDSDNPTGVGDLELLTHHQELDGSCRNPAAIEIQLASGGDYHNSTNVLRISLSYGVQCIGRLQKEGTCEDLKIRYCCPIKTKLRCAHPGIPSNGFARLRSRRYFLPGETVTYSCRRNYALSGAKELKCMPDETWSAEIPSCANPGPQICKDPKVYAACASICPPTCADPEPTCAEHCDRFSFCRCPIGMLQHNAEDTTCVLPSECKAGLICPGDKVYSPCVSKCQATCEDPEPVCDGACDRTKFCACPAGTVIKPFSDECIERSLCPTME